MYQLKKDGLKPIEAIRLLSKVYNSLLSTGGVPRYVDSDFTVNATVERFSDLDYRRIMGTDITFSDLKGLEKKVENASHPVIVPAKGLHYEGLLSVELTYKEGDYALIIVEDNSRLRHSSLVPNAISSRKPGRMSVHVILPDSVDKETVEKILSEQKESGFCARMDARTSRHAALHLESKMPHKQREAAEARKKDPWHKYHH